MRETKASIAVKFIQIYPSGAFVVCRTTLTVTAGIPSFVKEGDGNAERDFILHKIESILPSVLFDTTNKYAIQSGLNPAGVSLFVPPVKSSSIQILDRG